jgi:phospholipid/cholesterol/gamma-HCH transport system ATP-binding protein
MIEIKNIKKSFNGKDVLLGIDGVFKKGETNLIIGGSGTGKSVLLKCIIGLIQPDEGEVLYDGRSFYGGDKDTIQSIRREMGVLFQGGALFDSKTVAENVRFPLDMLTEQSASEKSDRVNFCLERVGLDQASNRIVMNPKYLFCDEPNSGLDPLTAVKIDELIQEITQEYQITTVVITHDMNSVMEIGQNIIFLYQGKKLWEGNENTITHSDVPELNEFLFSNKLLRDLRKSG